MIRNRKILLLKGYFISSVLFVLAMGVIYTMVKIHVAEGKELDEFAEQNFRLKSEPAKRGNLYASEGDLLATTITVHDIFMDPTVVKDKLWKAEIRPLCDSLSAMFDKPSSYFEEKLTKERKKGNRYMTLIKGLDFNEFQRMKSFPIFNKGQNKGGFIHLTRTKRELVLSDVGARIIGYDDNRGRAGLEGAYSEDLSGTEGKRWEQFMGRGRWKPSKAWEQEPMNGSDVYTTIDAGMQVAAYSALWEQMTEYNAEHGCVAVMEVKTGKIRAIANLTRMEDGEFADVYNYVVGESSEPGSTFKTVALLAGLEDEKFDTSTTVETGSGRYRLYNRVISDTRGYGTLNLTGVLVHSSNIGTAKLIDEAYGKKPKEFFKHLDQWNLTRKMDIDISGEATPQFHKPGDADWAKVTLPVMAYGYGLQITPLSLLTFYNGIANDGKMLKPLFIDKMEHADGRVVEFEPEVLVDKMASPQNIAFITEMLRETVASGTGRNIFTEHYEIAGKTGTARVEYWIKDQPMQYRASFAGFFPADDPEYTCIVMIYKPEKKKGIYGGTVTAPVFKHIADWVYSRTPRPVPPKGTWVNVEKVIEADTGMEENHEMRRVPRLIGKSGESVIPGLENIGFDVRYTGTGKVVSQSLPPGTAFKKGETIILELEG